MKILNYRKEIDIGELDHLKINGEEIPLFYEVWWYRTLEQCADTVCDGQLKLRPEGYMKELVDIPFPEGHGRVKKVPEGGFEIKVLKVIENKGFNEVEIDGEFYMN